MNEIIVKSGGIAVLSDAACAEIIEIENAKKALKAREETLKSELLKAMEDNDIIKMVTSDFTVTRVLPTDRETFDTKRFREEHPDMYDDYVEMKPVKGSLRIKLK